MAEVRVPSDRRRLQAEGSDQPAAAAFAGGARARRRRLLVRQSCARRRHRRPAARHSRHHRDALRCATGEGRRHARRGRRDRLLRPPNGKPRSDRRPHRRRNGCSRRAELRRSGDRCGTGDRRAGNRRAARPGAETDHRPVRRRRARIGHRSGRSRRPRSSIVEPEGWDDMAHSLEARRDRAGRRRTRPILYLDALQTPKVSPITFGILREREATALWVSDERSVRGGALCLGTAPAGRRTRRRCRRWRRCSPAKSRRSRIPWWCSQAGISIRRFTRGSSAAR